MTKDIPDNQPRQSFKAQFSSEVFTIYARLDKKCGGFVILWKDIHMGFPNVQHVLDGSNIVSLLTDDDFEELIPHRIAYHPGTVLEVVISDVHGNHSPDTSSPIGMPHSPQASTPMLVQVSSLSASDLAIDGKDISIVSMENTSASQISSNDSESLFKPDDLSDVEVLDIGQLASTDLSERSRATLLQVRQLNDSYLDAIKLGQVSQATDIKNTMKALFDTVLSELDKGNAFQDELLRMQELMLEKQQQALDANAITQKNIQAVFTQTYELHEFPIPRLFIVLPKVSTGMGKVTKPFSHQFRLFFLCECGTHTMTKEGGLPPRIHLANHEGYNLEKPTEFFEKYGSYLLTMMQMVKYGVTAAGVVVPSCVSGPLGPLVDESIKFLNGQKEITDASKDLAIYGMSDRQVILEGADLRKLSFYLKITDKDNALGNLFRMVTPEGHVKWVCSKHYREGYREAGTETLQDVVKVNRGQYERATNGGDKIMIKLDSSIQAQQFYGALAKAMVVAELDLTLGWDASMDDLKTFVLALSKTTVNKLTVNGGSFKNPTLDLVHRARRFEPLMQLLFNDRIQSLHFKDFDDFFYRVGDPQPAMAPKLRYIAFTTGSVTKGKNSREVLTKILKSAPSLAELRLSSQSLFEYALGQVSNNLRMTTVAWDGNGFSAEAHFRLGSMKALMLKVKKLEYLSLEDQKFALSGQLSGVRVDQTPRKADEALLRKMVQQNPGMSVAIIHSDISRAVPLLDLLVSTRNEIFAAKQSCSLGIITVQDISREDDRPALYETSVKYPSDSSEERTVLSGLNMSASSNINAIALADYLRLYGESMEYVVASKEFTGRHAGSLRNASSLHLQVLKLHPSMFSDASLDAIDHYIEGSQVLKKLSFTFELMGDERQRGVAVRLLNRHCQQVTATAFIGEASNSWLSQLSPALPPRSKFPNLQEFSILLADVTAGDLQWIASMVSAQSRIIVGQAGSRRTCVPITMFALGGSTLAEKDWATLIKALDFNTLETLIVQDQSFSTEQFRLLVEYLPDNVMSPLPLDNVAMWDREHGTDMDELIVQFHCKAPNAKLHFVLEPNL